MRIRGCLVRARPHGDSRIRRIFVGYAGVRAGWRLLVFFALLASIAAAFGLLAHLAHLAEIEKTWGIQRPQGGPVMPPAGPAVFVLIELSLLVPTALATSVMALLEDRGFGSFGLSGTRRASWFAIGGVCGLLLIGLLVTTLVVTGYNVMTVGHHRPAVAIVYGLVWLAVFLLVGFTEEFTFRGYLLTTLIGGIGFWPAAIATSLWFGAVHGVNPGETPVGLITAIGAGLLFCIGIRATGSLWWAIGVHALWDWSESYLYGSDDSGIRLIGRLLTLDPRGNIYLSGGATGPEGSVFSLIALLIASILALRLLRAR